LKISVLIIKKNLEKSYTKGSGSNIKKAKELTHIVIAQDFSWAFLCAEEILALAIPEEVPQTLSMYKSFLGFRFFFQLDFFILA
jgi:hypothetical protein